MYIFFQRMISKFKLCQSTRVFYQIALMYISQLPVGLRFNLENAILFKADFNVKSN